MLAVATSATPNFPSSRSDADGAHARDADYTTEWIVPGSLANWRLLRQKNGGNVDTPLTGALRVLIFEKLGLHGEYTPEIAKRSQAF